MNQPSVWAARDRILILERGPCVTAPMRATPAQFPSAAGLVILAIGAVNSSAPLLASREGGVANRSIRRFALPITSPNQTREQLEDRCDG